MRAAFSVLACIQSMEFQMLSSTTSNTTDAGKIVLGGGFRLPVADASKIVLGGGFRLPVAKA